MSELSVNQVSLVTLLNIVESSPNGIIILNAVRCRSNKIEDFRVVYSNQLGLKQLGWTADFVLNRKLSEIFPDSYELLYRYKQVVETGLPERFELPYSLGDSTYTTWYECSLTKQEDGVVVTLADITKQKQVQQRADRMVARLHSVLDSSQAAICLMEAVRDKEGSLSDFKFVAINDIFCQMLGYQAKDVIGEQFLSVFKQTGSNGLMDTFVQVVQTGVPYSADIDLSETNLKGWFSMNVVKQADGLAVSMLIKEPPQLQDLSGLSEALKEANTEAGRSAQELTSSKELLLQIADATPDVITIFDLEQTNATYINRTLSTMLGYSLEELTALGYKGRLEKIIYADDRHKLTELHQCLGIASDDDIQTIEYRIIHKDGTLIWIRNRSKIFKRNEFGKVTHLISVLQDITQQKAAEEKLRESEHFIRQVAAATPDTISVLDLVKWEFIYLNKDNTPYDPNAPGKATHLCYSQVLNSIHPDDREKVEAYNRSFLTAADGQIHTVDYRVVDDSGAITWYRGRGRVFKRDKAGNVTQRLCLAQDITQQVLAEQKIRETADKLQAVLDGAPVGIALLEPVRDAEGQTIDFWASALNRRFALRKGHTLVEILAKPFSEVFPAFPQSELFGQFARVADTGLPLRREMYINDGRAKGWYQVSAVREGKSVIVTSVDISDRKQAEDTVQQMLNGSMAAIAMLKAVRDTDGVLVDFIIQAVNVAGEELSNLPAEDLIGQPIQDLLADDLALLFDDFSDVVNTGQPQRMQFEVTYEQVDYWFDLSVVKQDDGLILTCLDVSEVRRVQQQLETTIAELKRSYETLEHFGLIASHDLQEQLRQIQAFGDVLVNQYSDQISTAGADIVYRMQRSASQMQLLIKDLLTYSRLTIQKQSFQKINLETMVQEVLADFSFRMQEKRAQVVIESLPVLTGDMIQFRLLFSNLIANALKFSRPEVSPEVVIKSRIVSGRMIEDGPEISSDKNYYEISVSDNGIGFDPKFREQIFGPLQRLNSKVGYGGTGIGLAVCKRVVENHGGVIKANSQPGQGTTFLIYIPAPRVN